MTVFLLITFLIAALQTPKTLGGGTPPRGASIRRPPGTACGITHQVLRIHRFWEGRWGQVGSELVSEIDVNFERPIFTKTYKKTIVFQ